MGNIAKICSIKKASPANDKTTANSLAQKGYNRQPGTVVRRVPYKEADGRYRTGLDENATYIDRMPKEEQKIERDRVKALREKLEAATGLKLGPRNEYYSGIFGEKYGTKAVAEVVKLQDGENSFNLDDPFQAITFAWISVHPMIAKSYEHYRSGKTDADVQFYVSDPEVETNMQFNENIAIDKAIAALVDMTPEKRKTVARLLSLPVSDNDNEKTVYNLLTQFIKSGEIKSGENKGFRSVALFNNIVDLKDSTMQIKDLIKQAINLGVYRKKAGVVYEGELSIADDEEMLLRRLASSKGQEEYLALEKKINEKKLIAR